MADDPGPVGGGDSDDGSGGDDGRTIGDGPGGGTIDWDNTIDVVGDLGVFLKSNFLTGDNQIQWKALAAGLFGGLWLAIWQGLIGLPLAVGELLTRLTVPVTSAIESGADGLADELLVNSQLVWDAANFGFISVVVNLAVALAAGAVIAWGVN